MFELDFVDGLLRLLRTLPQSGSADFLRLFETAEEPGFRGGRVQGGEFRRGETLQFGFTAEGVQDGFCTGQESPAGVRLGRCQLVERSGQLSWVDTFDGNVE